MISKIFINRPRFAIVISIVIMLAGALCLFQLPIAEYPEVAPPTITVNATYPGASSEVISNTVAAPIESQVNGVEGMIYYSSKSDNSGQYQLTATFRPGYDSDIAQVNIQNRVNQAQALLPTEVQNIGLTVKKQSNDMLGVFTFYSPDESYSKLDLSNFVSRNIKDRIGNIDGVSSVTIFGELTYSMRIWLNYSKMAALNITSDEIRNAITSQNTQAAIGSVGSEKSSGYIQYKLNAQGRLKRASEFENIIIKTGEDGATVKTRDVARVELGAKNYSNDSFYNGSPATSVAVYRSSEANALDVINNIKAMITKEAENFPKGIKWRLVYDPTEFVKVTLKEIVVTLLITVTLVIIITYLFLQDIRATVIPAATIPVSLIGTFLVLSLLGYSANTLTLFALILAIGIVVDDAIVVVENVMRLIEEEKLSPRQATIKAMQQVTGAVIATTLVLLAVFAPIGFYGGMIGTIYKQFAVTICAAVSFSTLNALTLSPALCSIILKPHNENSTMGKFNKFMFMPFNVGLNITRGSYLLVTRYVAKFAIVAMVIISFIVYMNVKSYNSTPTGFLPNEDKGVLFGDIALPAGATITRTNEVIEQVYQITKNIKGVKEVICVGGFSLIGGTGENKALLIVMLNHWDERPIKKDPELDINFIKSKIEKICFALPEAQVRMFTPPAIMGVGGSDMLEFNIETTSGDNPFQLEGNTMRMLGMLMQNPLTMFAFSSYEASTPQLFLELDRDKAEALKIPINRVFSTLQAQLGSLYVNDFNLYGRTYQVKIQAENDLRKSFTNIRSIHVQNDVGDMVPITSFATLKPIVGPQIIQRYNQNPGAGINAMPKPGVTSGQYIKMVEKVAKKLPVGYQVRWLGTAYHEKGNENKILQLLFLALIMGYLFLVAQYESWTIPMPVILSIFVATLGALLALKLFGGTLDIYAQLGLVMLVGLASKNGILIVEFAKQRREEGLSVFEAGLDAAKTRYRAVLMTALSFVIGVYPLVEATGAGAASRQAIGKPVFWGMLAATIVGIVLIPAMYVFFQSGREMIYKLIGKNSLEHKEEKEITE
ncbi:efflux RND transporter permease subunit [Lentisphaerota bacterium WC36G]|nr:efflux RND transporter permease subunit [Lentisphaerae bacterium WC36]